MAPASAQTASTADAPLGHRERLIAAMAASIEEKGFRDTTVADVVRLARTSRRNFYEHFEDRDACLLALFDAANQAMLESIATAVDPDSPLEAQVDDAVEAYIAVVIDQPALWASFVREMPGLGEAGAVRAQQTLERFAAQLIELVEAARRARPGVVAPLDPDSAIIIVGGLRELLVTSIQQGREMSELRASAGQTIKAILTSTIM